MTVSEHWGRRGGGWVAWAAVPLFLFLTVPLLALLMRLPPSSLIDTLRQPEARTAIVLSLGTSAMTTLIGVAAGLPLAWVLARRRFRGRQIVDTVVDLPMVLPPAVAGIALLMAFGRRGMVGQWLAAAGVGVVFTPAAVVMAQLFVAVPFFVRAATSALAGVDHALEEAAMLDGASPVQVFRFVILPRVRNILLSGAVMMWARALGEFGATIIFAGNFPGRTQTMPLAIYLGFELELAVALTLSVILLGLAFVVLLVVKRVLHGQLASVRE